MPSTSTLTPKQRLFVEAYQGNATEAALAAGYSKKTARFIGRENLTKPNILSAIKERGQEALAHLIAGREERQQFLTGIMRSTEERTTDKLKACDQLSKISGDYVSRHIFETPESLGVATCEQKSLEARERLLVLRAEREARSIPLEETHSEVPPCDA